MIEFNHLNFATEVPRIGDVLVIKTHKSGDKLLLCQVKDVINYKEEHEIILQNRTNSFFNWEMFYEGKSWVRRVWNLGKVELTTSVNNFNQFYNY